MLERSRLLTGISLVSAEILALEIILTRFFSISQGYHYAFLVVSIAFLGFGAGSLFLFSRRLKKHLGGNIILPALAFSLSLVVPLIFYLLNKLPFNPIELLWNQKKLGIMPLHFLIISIPFLLGGLTISLALTRFAGIVHKIYFADLLGAAAGIIFSAGSFRLAGDRGAIYLLVLLALTASWLFITRASLSRTWKICHFLGTAMVLVSLFLAGKSLSFQISDYKPLPFYLRQKGAVLTDTRWDEKLRLDLFESPAVRYAPGLSLNYCGNLPDQTGLSLDAERIYAISRQADLPRQLSFLEFLPLWPAFELNRGGRFLLLKPSGDLELLLSLNASASSLTVFEENNLLEKVHAARIEELAGAGLELPLLNIRTIETRAGLHQEKKKQRDFDLIVFPLPDLPGSFSTGFFGPGEDYLMTLEAFDSVFELLSPRGLISALFYFLPPPRQELRFLAMWVEILERRGLRPEKHIITLRSIETITFFIKKEEFSAVEIDHLKKFASERLYDLIIPGEKAEENELALIQSDQPGWDELAGFLFDRETRQALYRNYLFDIRPPRDNRPFFRDFMKWERWTDIRKFFNLNIYPLFLGKYLLAFLLIQALVIGLVVIILPLLGLVRRQLPDVSRKSLIFFYFACLGAGYMLVEITLFHKFILLIGHPTYSLSAVLFFLLSASGAGSLSLKILRLKIGQSGLIYWPLFCVGLILLEIAALRLTVGLFLNLSLPGRFLLCFLLIFPLGFCLGIPFPAGLSYFQSRSQLITPLAFAANAFFSLLASVWGLVQAQLWGYRSVLVFSAVCYLLSFLFFYLAHHRNKADIK